MVGRRDAAAGSGLERERIEIDLPDGGRAELLRVRDPRARRIRLLVGDDGARLTLPRSVSLRQAEAFVREHGAWLAAQLRRRAALVEASPRLEPGHPGPLPLRGRDWPLAWRPGRYVRVEFEPEPGRIAVSLPARAGIDGVRRALRECYLAEARADLGRWLPKYLPGLPAVPAAIRIRPLSSLWGSLSAGNALSLDLSLILAPPEAFEYVLVHELCHLIERNHSPAFWAEVEARCPDWRERRHWFREHGQVLKTGLRRLIEPAEGG